MEELSEQQLRAVFNSVDTQQCGSIGLRELQQVVVDVGLLDQEDSEALNKLDKDGSGEVDFDGFCSAVRMLFDMQKSNPLVTAMSREKLVSLEDLRAIGLGNDSLDGSRISIGDTSELNETSEEAEDVFAEKMQLHNGSRFQTPVGARRFKRSASLSSFSPPGSMDGTEELETLREKHDALQSRFLEREEEFNELHAKYQRLVKRCEEYDEQLKDAEDLQAQKSGYEMTNLTAALQRAKLDRDELEKEMSAKVADLEGKLSAALEETATLRKTLSTKEATAQLANERASDLEIRLSEVERLLATAQEGKDAEIQQLREQHESHEASTVQLLTKEHEQARAQSDAERERLLQEIESLKAQFEQQQSVLESEVDKLRTENSNLENALRDTEDRLQRQTLKNGFELSASAGESLDSEIAQATKDTILDRLQTVIEERNNLRAYMEEMLCNIITKHPDLLEIPAK
eukprot:m.161530 g.161530  ORF g.161530 m.161530 type:complete len:461 (-) comp10286_c0_seq1:205-1587(-)